MIVDVIMPKLGESITEGTIIEWNKEIGDIIKQDETILEISTDKVDSEVPSPSPGNLIEILYKPNDVVPVGEVIARIGTEGEDSVDIDSVKSVADEKVSKSTNSKEEAVSNSEHEEEIVKVDSKSIKRNIRT